MFAAHNQFMGIYVGFDPGGEGAFGWAILSSDAGLLQLVDCGIADHAQGAFRAAMDRAGNRISAVGIDAPLFWVPNGGRHADHLVRQEMIRLREPHEHVLAINSLQGACLIQGMLVAIMCQPKMAKAIPLTEAHPKALRLIGSSNRERSTVDLAVVEREDCILGRRAGGASDDERDAVLSAIAAFAMDSQLAGWHDLYAFEPAAITPLSPPPGYWMPLDPEGGPSARQ